MKLLFKQRAFSWFDSYDVYDEAGNTIFTVKGQFAWGKCLKIFDNFKNLRYNRYVLKGQTLLNKKQKKIKKEKNRRI